MALFVNLWSPFSRLYFKEIMYLNVVICFRMAIIIVTYVTSWDAHPVLCIITHIMYCIFNESDYSLCKVGWNVTLYNVNTLLHALKQIIMKIQNDTQSLWYMCFLYVSGICVFLLRHNTTKACAISLNTKARLHIRSYIMKLHIKTMLHANIHVQTTYRGTQHFPPAQWGGPIPRIISNIPSCLA